MTPEFDRATLERLTAEQLLEVADAVGVIGAGDLLHGQLIDAILEAQLEQRTER